MDSAHAFGCLSKRCACSPSLHCVISRQPLARLIEQQASEQDGGAVECLPDQLLDNLHRVVTATYLARCVVNGVISEAVDAALTKQRTSSANTAASF